MNDPVLETLAKFNDESLWEDIKYHVPIFVEHELWEIPHPFTKGETTRVAILPGQPKPKEGKMLYAIGMEDLTKIAKKINQRLNESGNAVKLFVGHTNNGLPQTQQPPLVGYGVGASVGPSGPRGRLAVRLDKLLHSRGSQHRDYPERSPEFDPIRGEITALALLKTDPKLPMGLVTYAADVAGYQAELKGTICYAAQNGVMNYADMAREEIEKPATEKPEQREQEPKEPYKALETPQQSDSGPDPTAPPNPVELDDQERMQADRFMKYYESSHPVMRSMCAKYASDQQAMQAPLGSEQVPGPGDKPPEAPANKLPGGEGTGDKPPPGAGKPEKPATEVKMATDVLPVQYAQLANDLAQLKKDQAATKAQLAALDATNKSLSQNYALEQSKRMLTELATEGYIIKDVNKALGKMVKMDDAGRIDYATDIRENYGKKEMAPVGPMIGIFDEPATLPGATGKEASREEVDQVVAYAAEHKIDLDSKDGFEKCLKEIRKVG